MSKEKPIEEYKIISENIRWYSNMRFAQLTLFTVTTAAIANGVYYKGILLPSIVFLLLKIGGIVASALFFYLELRADDYWSHFIARAVELEKTLAFTQYTTRPKRKLRTTFAIRFFIFGVGIFWLVNLFVR